MTNLFLGLIDSPYANPGGSSTIPALSGDADVKVNSVITPKRTKIYKKKKRKEEK